MLIRQVSLTNFRNHSLYHLDCRPDTTLIIGKNGCGKTSVLEAIYILMNGKSFRATDPEIIKRGAAFYRIELEYDNGETIVATYNGTTKTFIVGDGKARRLPKKHRHPVILFEPPDLNLVGGSPARHRDYFNRFFGQLSSDYASCVSRYDKALRQRNQLLKSEHFDETALASWDLLLARYGTKLRELRQSYTQIINHSINTVYHSIAENQDVVSLAYRSSTGSVDESAYLQTLNATHAKDRCLGHTYFGVHKDDFDFIFNDKQADGSASRGETRSIILALKFIEADTIYHILHEKPIILLDDVFSELDDKRRRCLVSNFKNHQVIITSVESPKSY